jgi:hypothetical protein
MTGARGDDRVRIRFEEEEERSSEGRDLFLDFDLEAGMLDEVDDEVRELLGNGGEILPSEGSAKPEWEASASFRIREGCHGTIRLALQVTRISSSCSLSRRTVLTIIQAVAPARPARSLQRARVEMCAAIRPSHHHGRSLFPRRLKQREVPQKPTRTC